MIKTAEIDNVQEFKYGKFTLSYPPAYYTFLKEQYIFDIYRSYLLEKGQHVLDLGANIGSFSILASKRVGEQGSVISVEPNKTDYDLLLKNIELNGCTNVVPVNLGVADSIEKRSISFWRGTFQCFLKPLAEILKDLNVADRFDFIKMDVEGFEIATIESSIDIIKKANIISMECHNNKSRVDELLLPVGYRFYPIDTSYVLKNLVRNFLTHPSQSLLAIAHTVSNNPKLFYKILRGYDMNKEHADNIQSERINSAVGSYCRIPIH